MASPAPNAFHKGLWTNFDQMLATGAVAFFLLALLLGLFLAPSEVAGAAMGLVGVWLVITALLFLVRTRQAARRWQRVPLGPVEANIGTEAVMLDTHLEERYFPSVRYEYVFDGVRYSGRCYHLDAVSGKSFDLKTVQALIARAEAATQVFVNPKDPAQSCLFAEQPCRAIGRYLVVLFIGLLFVGLSVSVFVHG